MVTTAANNADLGTLHIREYDINSDQSKYLMAFDNSPATSNLYLVYRNTGFNTESPITLILTDPSFIMDAREVKVTSNGAFYIMLTKKRIAAPNDFLNYIVQITESSTTQIITSWTRMETFDAVYATARFREVDGPNNKFIYSIIGKSIYTGVTYSASQVFSIIATFPAGQMANDCRVPNAPTLGGPAAYTTQLTVDTTPSPLVTSTFQINDQTSLVTVSDMFSPNSRSTQICPTRTIQLYAPLITSAIAYNTGSGLGMSTAFLEDPRMALVTDHCDREDLHYELRINQGATPTPMPPGLTLVQTGGVFAIDIDPPLTPIQGVYSMGLALVDTFGKSAIANFILIFINPTTTSCQSNILSPPIIQDQTYLIGDTPKYFQAEFIHPGSSGVVDCYTLVQFSVVAVYPTGLAGGLPPTLVTFDSVRQGFIVYTEDEALMGTYEITLTAILPVLDTFGKVKQASTKFKLKIIQWKMNQDEFCELLPPNMVDQTFTPASQTVSVELGSFQLSSTRCEKLYENRGELIEYNIYEASNRLPSKTFTLQNCFTVLEMNHKIFVSYYKSAACVASTRIYNIRVEAFILAKGSDFRRLSNITSVQVILSNDNYCSKMRIFPPPPLWNYNRNYLVKYIDVKGVKTPNTLAVNHNFFWGDSTYCWFANYDTSFNNYFTNPYGTWLTFNYGWLGITPPTVLYDVLVSASRRNSFNTGNYYITLRLFDSTDCTIEVDKGTALAYQFTTQSKSRTFSMLPMVINPQCMYKHLRYTLESASGYSMPGFLEFIETPFDRTLVLKNTPSRYDVGTFYLTYRGQYNPVMYATATIKVTVDYAPSSFTRDIQPYLSLPKDLSIQAGAKIQINVAIKARLKYQCSASYKGGTEMPNFTIFSKELCAFIFSPTDFNIGKYPFQVQLVEDNPLVRPVGLVKLDAIVTVTPSIQFLLNQKQAKLRAYDALFSAPYKIQSISSFGLVDIKFLKKMRTIQRIDELLPTDIVIVMVSGDGESETTIEWKPVSFDKQSSVLRLQLYFDNPAAISTKNDKDVLQIRFNKTQFFLMQSEVKYVDSFNEVSKAIPRQNSLDQALLERLSKSLGYVQGATNSIMFGNLGLNILMSASLQLLWGMINTLQIIVILPLFALAFPGNLIVFFQAIAQITRFNILPAEMIIKYFIHFEANQEPLNSNFEAMGYTNMSSLLNLDTIFLLFVASSAMLIGVALINNTVLRLLSPENRLRVWFQKKEDQLFFGYMLRFIIESYIEITLASIINIQMLTYNTTGEMISSIFAQLFGAIFILFPLWCLIFLLFADTSTPRFEKRYGELTHELKAEEIMPRLFHFFFTLRRLLLAMIAVLLRDQPIIQLMLFQMISIFNIAYLVYNQPFREPVTNKLETFNEVCILLVGYTLFIYTDFIDDFELQVLVGYIMIGIIGLNFLGNLSVICFGMYRKLQRVWKHRVWYKAYWRLQLSHMCSSKKVQKAPESDTQPEELAYNLAETKQHFMATTQKNGPPVDVQDLDDFKAYSIHDDRQAEELFESEYDQEADDVESDTQEANVYDKPQLGMVSHYNNGRSVFDEPLPHQKARQQFSISPQRMGGGTWEQRMAARGFSQRH